MDIFRNARQNFLRRQAEAEPDDVERQLPGEDGSRRPEMQEHSSPEPVRQERPPQVERPSPVGAALRRFADMPRPSIPSFASRQSGNRPRPSSSRYDDSNGSETASPKTPQFALGMPQMPSTRLHLPNLQRTWTQGSNGPPSRPGTARSQFQMPMAMASSAHDRGRRSPSQTRTGGRTRSRTRPMSDIAEPVPLVPAEHMFSRNRGGNEATDDPTEIRYSDRRGRRRRFDGADPAELHLESMVNDGRRRRRRRGGDERSRTHHRLREHATGDGQQPATAPTDAPAATATATGKPKRFLFCFPHVKSRRMRAQILRCFVAGSFLALMLAVFLALSMTHNIYNSEFAVLLILILLFATVFFAHGLIRLCIMVVRPPSPAEELTAESSYRRRRGAAPMGGVLPDVYGLGGYAIPQQPIRVVLARDEEAAGLESVTTKIQPPAYGLWRESVRVDPNRIYWQRSEEATANASGATSRSRSATATSGQDAATQDSSSDSEAGEAGEAGEASRSGPAGGPPRGRQSPRPPSYVSDDGVRYVVEAQPRSIAPTSEVPLSQHPAETGRVGHPAAW